MATGSLFFFIAGFDWTISVIVVWVLVESLNYSYYRQKLASMQQTVSPPLMSRASIQRNFEHICDYLDDDEAEQFLSDWFFGARFEDIYHDNLVEWMAWAFYGRDVDKLGPKDQHILNDMITVMEAKVHSEGVLFRFPPGYNPKIKSARLNLDPIMALPRPIIVYAVVYALELISHTFLNLKGFKQKSVLIRTGKQISYLTYYHRRALKTTAKHPLLFFHGIGIGNIMYLPLLKAVMGNREMIIVQMPEVANQSLACQATPPLFVKAISAVLRRHAIDRVCLMGHSYGTVVMAWMLKHTPNRVSGAIFLDPVCFLLFLPYTCMHFIYEVPQVSIGNLRACVVHFFAKRELGIAHTLQRHFWWIHNNIWSEDLCDKVMVVLAAEDEIAPAHPIWYYLDRHNKVRSSQGRPQVDVQWHSSGCHANCIFNSKTISKIRHALEEEFP